MDGAANEVTNGRQTNSYIAISEWDVGSGKDVPRPFINYVPLKRVKQLINRLLPVELLLNN